LTLQEQDFQCLQRAQAGDTRSLAELYDRYTPLLYPLALRILRSPADAEDAVQEAWIQVWKRAASYDPKRGTVAAWLLTVVRTRALDRYRSLSSRARAEGKVEADPVAGENGKR
jgi:RNA polymerase sigma-70 factor, ECF subfamily